MKDMRSKKHRVIVNIEQKERKREQILNNWLEYEIKISKRNTLNLRLSLDNYKEQFKDFVKENNLSKTQARQIRQMIKKYLDEQLQQMKHQDFRQEEQHVSFDQNKKKCIQIFEEDQIHKQQSFQNINMEEYQNISQQDLESSQKVISKDSVQVNRKLFYSGVEQQDIGIYQQEIPVQQEEDQIKFQHQFSSIHELDNIQDENYSQRQESSGFYEYDEQQMISTNIGTNRPTHLFSQQSAYDNMRYDRQRSHISSKQKRSFFILQNDQISMPKSKKQDKRVIQSINQRKMKKFKQTKQIPIYQKNSKLKISNQKQKSPSKSKDRKLSSNKKQQVNEIQNELNQKVFHRLNKQQTQNFKQKYKLYQKPHYTQLRDERIVNHFRNLHNDQFNHLSSKQKIQIFHKLHQASTQSSLNKKYDPNRNINYELNQIQNVINLSAKKNNQPSLYQKRTPNMKSQVYQPFIQKTCNAHCQQYEHQKKINQQNQKMKQKQQRIKDQIRSKSKESCSSKNFNSKNQIKKSGECLCCHHEQIEKKRKLNQKKQREKQRSYTCKTKYSIQKLFPPYNQAQIISDVLQESYNELFPQK